MNNIRLQKYLSACGIASRRKAEQLILDQRVQVNEQVVDTLGYKVSAGDIIKVDQKVVLPKIKKYILLNKPPGYLCSKKDQWQRKTVFDLIADGDPSLFHAGRLDYLSSGLLILTNDGDFANSIIHPSHQILKGYLVTSDKAPPKKMVRRFLEGVQIKQNSYQARAIKQTNEARQLIIILNEGKKREIREVYHYFGLNILELKRIFIGQLQLSDYKLDEGEYLFLSKKEIYEAIHGKNKNCD